MNKTEHARLLRAARKIHRWMGATLFILFLFVSISGLLLTWKKNSFGLILSKTYQGTSTNLKEWLSYDSLQTIAFTTLNHSIDDNLSLALDRIDARPEKGVVKFVFKDHYWGIQLDGATGKVLSVEKRRADLIENIHDGSILDYIFQTKGGILKLIYSSVTGFALLLFTITGFWLWYGPKVMRKNY